MFVYDYLRMENKVWGSIPGVMGQGKDGEWENGGGGDAVVTGSSLNKGSIRTLTVQ